MNGQELKELRAYLGLSQSQLAIKLGVTANQVYKLEAGKNKIQGPTLILINYLQKEHSQQAAVQPLACTQERSRRV